MIDANVHLLKISSDKCNSPNDVISQLKKEWESIKKDTAKELLQKLSEDIHDNGIHRALLYALDEDWKRHDWFPAAFPDNIIPGMLVNPLSGDIEKQLDILKSNHVKFVKILPYEQRIFRDSYKRVLEFVQKIEERNMVLTVCCAYGSRYLYDTNGVELVSYLVNHEINTPIIMAHGGMVKVFDALSLMVEFPNLYMDISFTIPYWWDSSVLDDYAFVFKKLSCNRIFYGSDYPYVELKKACDYFERFCDRYGIAEGDKNKILHENFEVLLGKI